MSSICDVKRPRSDEWQCGDCGWLGSSSIAEELYIDFNPTRVCCFILNGAPVVSTTYLKARDRKNLWCHQKNRLRTSPHPRRENCEATPVDGRIAIRQHQALPVDSIAKRSEILSVQAFQASLTSEMNGTKRMASLTGPLPIQIRALKPYGSFVA
jgi:hypothetical protein